MQLAIIRKSTNSYFVLFCRVDIPVHVIDDESYEKDINFYIELGEPKQFKGKSSKSMAKNSSMLS